MMDWHEVADLVDVLDDVILEVDPTEAVAKGRARPDPLRRAGLDAWIVRVSRALRGAYRPAERDAIRRLVAGWSRVDWVGMGDAARSQIITRSLRAVADDVAAATPRIETVIRREVGNMIEASIAATQAGLPPGRSIIVPTTDRVDARVIEHAANSQSLYVSNALGERVGWASERARSLAADGLRQGFSSASVAQLMAKEIGAALARPSSYFDTVATIHMVRARTFGQLRGFERAQIRRYRFLAIRDRRTTDQCRFMHGRVFEVGGALQRYQRVADGNPEAVKDQQPFLQIGKNEAGERTMYYKRGERRTEVARIEESGVGKIDESGRYTQMVSDAHIAAAGLMTPPLHGRCRSILDPEFD